MKQADEIREFADRIYIRPAREGGLQEIRIRSGELHEKMNLKGRMPAVCGALGTEIFERQYGVKLIKREGPTNGSNVYFTFQL